MLRMVAWILAVTANAPGNLERSEYLVPPGWSGNPWGPQIAHARAAGQVPPVPVTPAMAEWDRWGRTALRDGDILFRRGDARILHGYFPFSRFIANADNSPYSHTGIVAIEGGAPVVYDTTQFGVRRQPLGVWMLDSVGAFGVKRLRPAYRDRIPQVLAYCRRVFEAQVPFDANLLLDDRALYCVEMTEKAFRAAGIPLSQPVRLGDMERAAEFPVCMVGLQMASRVMLDEPLTFEHAVYFPGNDRHGIWASPALETVVTVPYATSAAPEVAGRGASARPAPEGVAARAPGR